MKPLHVVLMLALSLQSVAATCAQQPIRDAQAAERHVLAPSTPQALQRLLHYTGDPLPLVSAHRGGARRGFPENCIATFEDTLAHTYSMLEIDPRSTKDGVIVVLHDATLERTTTGKGLVAEHTWEQLQELRLKDAQGQVTDFSIPTLDDVLKWARGKTVLVLDQKDVPLETRVKKVEEHEAEAYVLLIVSNVKDARACYALNKNIMMEVFLGDRQKFEQFENSGIPWKNLIAFVGHVPPQDKELLQMIHAKGTLCIVGTSRNLDREYIGDPSRGIKRLEKNYRNLLEFGADIIETDIPREVAGLLYGDAQMPAAPGG